MEGVVEAEAVTRIELAQSSAKHNKSYDRDRESNHETDERVGQRPVVVSADSGLTRRRGHGHWTPADETARVAGIACGAAEQRRQGVAE
jgi:hypothetical protein